MAMDLVMASIGENTRYGLGKERPMNLSLWLSALSSFSVSIIFSHIHALSHINWACKRCLSFITKQAVLYRRLLKKH